MVQGWLGLDAFARGAEQRVNCLCQSSGRMNKFLRCGIELSMLIHQPESISIKAKKTKANISHLSLQLHRFIPVIKRLPEERK